jgi:hypothetical protein
MARRANRPAGPSTREVNKPPGPSRRSGSDGDQTYSTAIGRRRGGRGSHRAASDGGGLMAAHSAKLITRPYRNTPPELVMP